jgi:hypothetical protein
MSGIINCKLKINRFIKNIQMLKNEASFIYIASADYIYLNVVSHTIRCLHHCIHWI